MSKQEFTANVRRAIRRLKINVSVDSSTLDPAQLSKTLNQSASWLMVGSVEGFDPTDFPELSATDKIQLEAKVAAFIAIASAVPPAGPATRQQSQIAREHLIAIAKLIGEPHDTTS